jgi:hypothetical protein
LNKEYTLKKNEEQESKTGLVQGEWQREGKVK